MSPRRGLDRGSGGWELVAEILACETYEQRLERLLLTVSGVARTSLAYLYLPEASGRRLRLERSYGAARDPNTEESPLIEVEDEGGVQTSAPSPPLELGRSAEDDRARMVDTPVGRMYAVPLQDRSGTLVGLVQAGPLNSAPSRGVAAGLRGLAGPLGLALAQTRDAEAIGQRLMEATMRLEAQERIAGSALDLDRFTQLLLEMALASTGTEAGFVAIQGRADKGLEVRAQSGMPDEFASTVDLSPEDGLFDWSPAEYGGALALSDLDTAAALGIKSLLAVPLLERAEVLGIFALVNFGEATTFDESSLELCAVFANQIRLMLHNQRTFHNFADRYLGTMKGLARALDARTPLTHDHHKRVAELAASLAHGMGIRGTYLKAVWTAGLIHDVGLAAAGSAEDAAIADIEHPTVGAGLIEHLPLHPELAGAVATHHEWYDGWGFPRGLAGEQIPLGGRILAMAEFLVEMTTDTPVRAAWSTDRLWEEIVQRRGTQFDPAVVEAAIGLLAARSAQVLAEPGR